MRQAISSILDAVRDTRTAFAGAKQRGISQRRESPMMELDFVQLRHVAGGDDGDLPKGGWIAAAVLTA